MTRSMISLKILIFCLTIVNLSNSAFASSEDLELQTVVVVFRHGDRAPIDMYPNDPYKVNIFEK